MARLFCCPAEAPYASRFQSHLHNRVANASAPVTENASRSLNNMIFKGFLLFFS
jgi:hypothetical protein